MIINKGGKELTKIIETNLSMANGQIADHQSRVIEVENWNSYVNEIKNGDTVIRDSFMGCLSGASVPRQSLIENFEADDCHLSCDIYNYRGIHTKKLAYVAKADEKILFENGSVIKPLKTEGTVRGRGYYCDVSDFKREYDCEFTRESDKEF